MCKPAIAFGGWLCYYSPRLLLEEHRYYNINVEVVFTVTVVTDFLGNNMFGGLALSPGYVRFWVMVGLVLG